MKYLSTILLIQCMLQGISVSIVSIEGNELYAGQVEGDMVTQLDTWQQNPDVPISPILEQYFKKFLKTEANNEMYKFIILQKSDSTKDTITIRLVKEEAVPLVISHRPDIFKNIFKYIFQNILQYATKYLVKISKEDADKLIEASKYADKGVMFSKDNLEKIPDEIRTKLNEFSNDQPDIVLDQVLVGVVNYPKKNYISIDCIWNGNVRAKKEMCGYVPLIKFSPESGFSESEEQRRYFEIKSELLQKIYTDLKVNERGLQDSHDLRFTKEQLLELFSEIPETYQLSQLKYHSNLKIEYHLANEVDKGFIKINLKKPSGIAMRFIELPNQISLKEFMTGLLTGKFISNTYGFWGF